MNYNSQPASTWNAAERFYLDRRAWQAIDAEVIILQKSYSLLVHGFVREGVPTRSWYHWVEARSIVDTVVIR